MRTTAQHSAVNYGKFGPFRTFLATLMALSLFVPSFTFFVYQAFANQIASNVVDISAFLHQAQDENGQPLPEDSFAGRPVNILISGIDSRYDQGVNAHGDPEEMSIIFSDVTMVMHISADRSRINTVSIPRDLMTTIPSCIDANGNETGERFGQFNSAFAYAAVTNNLGAGIACTKQTVEYMTGLHLDGFVVVDFSGFVGLVDALGGVWYDVETRIVDQDSDADLHAGCQLLNGQQALSYARVRKSVGDGSDNGRMGRQQKLVAAMMREALSKNFVTDLPALLNFVQKGISAVQPSPSFANLNTDVALLHSVSSIKKENIQFMTMPVVPWPEDFNRSIAIDELAEQVWHSLRQDLPFPENSEVTTGAGTKALTVGDTSQSASLVTIEEEKLHSEAAEEEFGEESDLETSHESVESTESPSESSAPSVPAPPTPCPAHR